MRAAFIVAFVLAAAAATPAAAQVTAPGPPGPFVVDLHGVTLGVPSDPAFYPALPAGTIIPNRGFGMMAGGQVYLMKVGAGRLGVGGLLMWMRATTSPDTPAASPTSVPPPRTIPDVAVTATMLAPQVSLNFGSERGWSFVSGGYGTAQLQSVADGIPTVPPAEQDTGRVGAFNAGAGARWFRTDHLAFGFDVRVYLLQSAPRATLVSASVGISLR